MDNNQNNHGQFGSGQYYGNQPNMYQNNQYGQPMMNQNNQYGQPQMGYQNYQQPMGGYQMNRPTISKKEFYKDYATKGSKGNIQGAAVLLYFSFALNFFYSFMALGNTMILIDCIIILATALCIHILYSRIAAVVAAVYSIINVVLYLWLFGQFGGWLILVAGICACMGTFKLESEYKNYLGIR